MKYLKLDESGSNDELTVQYNSDGTVSYSTSKALPDYIDEEIQKKMPTNIGEEVQKELATYTGEATSLDAGKSPTCEFDATNKKVKIGVPKGAATVVQNTGTSESYVMSQKAITDALEEKQDTINTLLQAPKYTNNVVLYGKGNFIFAPPVDMVDYINKHDVISVVFCTLATKAHYYEAFYIDSDEVETPFGDYTVYARKGLCLGYVGSVQRYIVGFRKPYYGDVAKNFPIASPFDTNMFVLNKSTGTTKCYTYNRLVSTFTQDFCKNDYWLDVNKLCNLSWDSDGRSNDLVSFAIYSGDLSRYFNGQDTKLILPSIPSYKNNLTENTSPIFGLSGWTISDDNRYHKTASAGTSLAITGISGNNDRDLFVIRKKIELHSGSIIISGSERFDVWNESGESVTGTLTAGIYNISLTCRQPYILYADVKEDCEISIIDSYTATSCLIMGFFGGYDKDKGMYEAATNTFLEDKNKKGNHFIRQRFLGCSLSELHNSYYPGKVRINENNKNEIEILGVDNVWKKVNNA